ncbi:MAG: hypothetical protein RLZZ369_774, partial [Pseudomonadota bacterium]
MRFRPLLIPAAALAVAPLFAQFQAPQP